jgi:hypothetical protein
MKNFRDFSGLWLCVALAGCGADAENGSGGAGMGTDVGAPSTGADPTDPNADPTAPGASPTTPGMPAGPGVGGEELPDAPGPAEVLPVDPVAPGEYQYEAEEVHLDTSRTVAKGETLRVGPGTTFTSAKGVQLIVDGTLIVEGTPEARVRFMGAGTPRSWEGIVVTEGGVLDMRYFEIGGATYGIHAMPGSDFTLDHGEFGTSFKCAVIQSDGFIDHSKFHASGDPAFSISSAAPVTDVNGTLTIVGASPMVTNSTFDGSAALVDMIRVRDGSAPVLDHLYIKEAHCGVHMEGGTNVTPTVTNTVFEGLAYGVMAYTTKPRIESSVFMGNGNDIGFCFGATADNAPMLTGNFYAAGTALIDPSCTGIGTKDASPAAAPNPAAGPAGL